MATLGRETVIVVTGGAGFIGSNIARRLRDEGAGPLWIVDDLTDGTKFRNLVGLEIADYLDRDRFLRLVEREDAALRSVEAVVHQGACTSTTETDGRYVVDNNYRYARTLVEHFTARSVPFVYASSAAVYGADAGAGRSPGLERPLNVYGFSKLLLDRYVRRVLAERPAPLVGLRYFNVYGPGEAHKGPMRSVVLQFFDQISAAGVAHLFGPHGAWAAGEQRRDFVHVDDVASVVTWFLGHPERPGIFDVGTGRSRSFNEAATAVIGAVGRGRVEYRPFPPALLGVYQTFTEANLQPLREAGYAGEFRSLENGVASYVAWLRTSTGAGGEG